MNDIRSALAWAGEEMGQNNRDFRLDAEILLAYVVQKNRAYLFAHPEYLLKKKQQATFTTLITRRKEGVPIAYLTQQREFWSLSLKVNQHTLIPRHETERLIELALELVGDQPKAHVLDLGTGSGAIAIALAHERPDWQINACDLSEGALLIARENAQQLNIKTIHFYQSNWFEHLPHQQYHLIIANPPYLAAEDPHLNQGDLRFEPQSALVSGQDGLADLHYIINLSYDYLLPNGLLLVEHGYDQKDLLHAEFTKLGYQRVHCWQDMQGHDRVSGGWKVNHS